MKSTIIAAVLLGATALAQDGSLTIESTVPEGVPEGAQVSARIVSESGSQEPPEPIAVAEIVDGSFELTLPATVDASLLEEERLGCDGEDDLVTLGYLPFLTVDQEGQIAGALVRSLIPPGDWEMFAPPSTAYWVYLPEPLELDEACGSQSIDVSFDAGWNQLLFVREGADVSISDEPPPAEFRWHFQGRQ